MIMKNNNKRLYGLKVNIKSWHIKLSLPRKTEALHRINPVSKQDYDFESYIGSNYRTEFLYEHSIYTYSIILLVQK